MKIFRSFFKLHQSGILAFVLCSIVFVLIFSLYDLPVGAVLYSAVLSAVICLALFLASFIRYCKRCRMLQKMQQEITVTIQHLPQPQDCKEQAYQELLKRLFQKQQEQAQAWQVRCSDMMEYYTAWTHQMKTPIAAMQLHLQAEHSPENRALLDDLQRIEQYVEMVLTYLRMEDMASDLKFEHYPLDDLIRASIRKYSQMFILKKIRLEYQAVNQNVITDKKWLCFVIEQILSNALKYTKQGSVKISAEESANGLRVLVKDTGIGIRSEDLPRIFEKGFTGYNGRMDKKASGLGLYLCKGVCEKLGHGISVASKEGEGTTVMITLQCEKVQQGDLVNM